MAYSGLDQRYDRLSVIQLISSRVVGLADEDWANLDWSKAPAIQETPVTSAIVVPEPSGTIPKGKGTFAVKGYAFAGGGREVIRVDVSADGGKTWRSAKLLQRPDAADVGYRKDWAWKQWEVCSLFTSWLLASMQRSVMT